MYLLLLPHRVSNLAGLQPDLNLSLIGYRPLNLNDKVLSARSVIGRIDIFASEFSQRMIARYEMYRGY